MQIGPSSGSETIRKRKVVLAAGIMMAVALAGLAPVAAAQSTGADVQAVPTALPPGPGQETVVRVCSNCHALEIVSARHLSAPEWKEMVELMVRLGAVATDQEQSEIADYLINAFPAKLLAS